MAYGMDTQEKALIVAAVTVFALLLAGLGMTLDAAIVAAPSDVVPGGSGNMVFLLDGVAEEDVQDGGLSVPDVPGAPGGITGNHIYFPKNFDRSMDGSQQGSSPSPVYAFQESGPSETDEEEEYVCEGDCEGTPIVIEDLCIGFEAAETSCGIGACAAAGYTSCFEGQVTDSCYPGYPSDEICTDGIDNDCDGLTDCADESCARGDACVQETPSAPEFMLVVIPTGIIGLMLVFSYSAAKKSA